MIDNLSLTLEEDIKTELNKNSKLKLCSAYFSIYAFQELKKELKTIKEFNFLFNSPTFLKENRLKKEEKKFEKELKEIFNSLNLEILYEKLIKIILQNNSKKNIADLIQEYKRKQELTKEIWVLEKKIKTEKQANRNFKLFNELGMKKKELEVL